MRLLYDSKHFHIILIRHACEFLGYFTHIFFSYFVCGFCGFSGYCGFQNRRNRNNCCLYFSVPFKPINPHNRFFFYRLCGFTLLLYNHITSLLRTFYGHSTNVFRPVLSHPLLCPWRAVENLFSEGIPNPYRRSV